MSDDRDDLRALLREGCGLCCEACLAAIGTVLPTSELTRVAITPRPWWTKTRGHPSLFWRREGVAVHDLRQAGRKPTLVPWLK